MFDLLAQRAQATPERPALEDTHDGVTYNYRELNARAARFAAAARQHWRLAPGDRVAYLGHNRAEFFVMLFGCAKAGLILVPLNWRLARPELQMLMADAEPGALIYGEEFAETAHHLTTAGVLGIALEDTCIADNHTCYQQDLANATPDLSPHPVRSPDRPWYLLYTSGTTGRPKGVIQTFRMMESNYFNIGVAVGLTQDDVLLNVLPLFHTAGINLYSSAVLLAGGCVLVSRTFDAGHTLTLLAERATVFFAVPAIYQALREVPAFDARTLANVRSWGCGGAPLPLSVAKQYADDGIRIRTGMGMTETGPTVFLLDEDAVLNKPGSVGKPQLLVEVRIVDTHGKDVVRGAAGELLIRGPGVTPGYWNRPKATADAFSSEGWFHSGDVARCDSDGCYYIVDRWKDMFISGGENVYPAEVENVLREHPAIADVAVIGIADDHWGEVGKAYFSLAGQTRAPDTEELKAFCRARLAGYKVPRVFECLQQLPRNAVGKITKQSLRKS
ncbi:AMP-binding protein [Marinobacter sp. X15-166B]|uniref:AMP-binding protein n=1 Tax=Marinobacter sp. X15-166B TaxID=1897620 RepID=UPI0018E91377|nr:AMP-binding protein [Marinobacter sp. X15-166B]